jgi:hypothetical protein
MDPDIISPKLLALFGWAGTKVQTMITKTLSCMFLYGLCAHFYSQWGLFL